MRTFRDYEVGDRERLGPIRVTRAEALEFAHRYDPQPFHLSDAHDLRLHGYGLGGGGAEVKPRSHPAVTGPMRTFRDYEVGDRERLGPIRVTRAEALEFAHRYDPQPFHLCDAAAEHHPFFTRMAASGWLTCALMMRLIVDEMARNPVASVGTPGVDRIRWRAPVYPGDELMLEAVITGKRLLRSRPGVGLVHRRLRTTNQARKLVMTSEMWEFVALEAEAPERRHAFSHAVDQAG